jgi:hypothetical protein
VSWAWLERQRAGAADVYLAKRRVAVLVSGELVFDAHSESVEQGLEAMEAWLREAASVRAVRVWLSGGLCPALCLPAVEGLKSGHEAHSVALAQAGVVTGLQGPCEVWIDRFVPGRPIVGAAVESAVLARICSVASAGRQGVRLKAVRPWWGDVLRLAAARVPQPRGLFVQDSESITWITGADAGIDMATTFGPVISHDEAAGVRARALMSAEVPSELVASWALSFGAEASSPEANGGLAFGRFARSGA